MKVVQVAHSGGSYPVYVGPGLLAMNGVLERHVQGRALLVTDENVAGQHLERLRPKLQQAGMDRELVLPAGEEHKTVDQWQVIIDELVAMGAQRDATVLALGGGVIGDLAGFAAASYMRGIGVIQLPTTLLAQVDAAVGGKTGFNHAAGKNLVGAFHQPAAVVADVEVLGTLEERDYLAGLAEIVKYGAIRDARLFDWLELNADALSARLPEVLLEAVHESVRNKAEVVAADEREAGLRALLNFGHTFGHALETLTAYTRYRHGEAVAIGMVLAARQSELLGLTPASTVHRLATLLERLGLPTRLPDGIDRGEMVETMRLDKKNRSGEIRLVLLHSIGHAFVRACPASDILNALEKQ